MPQESYLHGHKKPARADPSEVGGCVPGSVTAVFLIALAGYASQLTVPNAFVNGTVPDADDMNANFDAAEIATNDNDTRVTTTKRSSRLRSQTPQCSFTPRAQ